MLIETVALVHRHEGYGPFAPPLARFTDHGRLTDARKTINHFLDLPRVHIHAVGLDHVLFAIGDDVPTVGAAMPDVAGQ